jgi:hypothetical protein
VSTSDVTTQAAISRREIIVGALALAAGTLVAGAPDTAHAANNDTILLGCENYATSRTKVILTDGVTEPAAQITVAYLNHYEEGTPGTHQALMGATDAAATPGSLGVLGWAHNADHVAVGAVNDKVDGIAVYAVGKVLLSRSGKVTISKGKSSATVTVASGVETGAMILVTPQGDGGSGVYVKYAARAGATSFKIVLTKKATKTAKYAWVILS